MFARLLLLATLLTVPGFCARGKIRDFVYISSKKDFTFQIPETPFKLKCRERREKDHVSVFIQGGFGQTYGVEKVLVPEHTMPYFKKSDEEALSDFLGRAVMVNYNELFPGAKIVYQDTRKLCDCIAYFVIIDKPVGRYTAEGEASNARGIDAVCVYRKDNELMILQAGNMIKYDTDQEEVVRFLDHLLWEQVQLMANTYQAT